MEKRTQEVEIRKKGKKLDWIIYILAFIALALMVIVIVSNNKIEVKITDIKPIITDMAEKDKTTEKIDEKFEPKTIEPKETIIAKKDEKEKKDETKIVEEKKQEIKKEETKKQTKIEEKKTKEIAKTEDKKIKEQKIKEVRDDKRIDYKNYNWKALKRYKAKPDKDLYIVSKYTVQDGDALWKIAQKMGVRTINIIAVNNISNPNLIFPGQVILIPNM